MGLEKELEAFRAASAEKFELDATKVADVEMERRGALEALPHTRKSLGASVARTKNPAVKDADALISPKASKLTKGPSASRRAALTPRDANTLERRRLAPQAGDITRARLATTSPFLIPLD